jgi:copper chaperone
VARTTSSESPTDMDEGPIVTTTSYAVAGLTCGDCIAEVMERVRTLVGVTRVTVDFVRGGSSPVTVTSGPAVGIGQVRDAVGEAGFDLTGEWTGPSGHATPRTTNVRSAERTARENTILGGRRS